MSDFKSSVFGSCRCPAESAGTNMCAMRRVINASRAPAAVGPYSHACLAGSTLYLSGQIGLDPASATLVTGGVTAETEQAFKNMGEVLKAAECTYENVVKTTVLLTDMKDFAEVNSIYTKYFKSNYPARSCFAVAGLPKGAKVEIEAIAIVGKIE